MKTLFVNARFIDENLLTNDIGVQKWHVHSKYKSSFNLQDERKQQLVVITTTNYPFMPNGIYLDATDFTNLLETVEINEQIIWQQNSLHFSNEHLFLMHGKPYSSKIERTEEVLTISLEKLLSYTNTVAKETGSQNTLANFVKVGNLFSEAIQYLCLEEQSQQESGLDFLIGRGPGLTPSGDDMVVGHLAARILLKEENSTLINLLTELLTEQFLTTDISKHYLLCALSGRFSEPVRNLVTALTTNSNEEEIAHAAEAIMSVGHTSGVDLLAGLITTIKFYRSK
ncbi:DUF2877 domain-containing protein [Candidatus Enterococcus lemimoniae]|uniref:DUF2877 domain-containing protein n=1 Tax=Candidatus Enterococcus lemimoniae TaxID=1834167 RepID=UPI0020CC357A|nr:DUF2877 domain-containing protein [Enterococcus sp. 12C11_DIV0727]